MLILKAEGSPKATLLLPMSMFLILAVVGAFLIAPHNKLPGRGNAPLPMKSLKRSAILQVELARQESDIVDVIGTGDVKRNVSDANAGNRLDTYLFVPGYIGLLVTVGLFLRRSQSNWGRKLLSVLILAVLAAGVCDWTENAGIDICLRHFKEYGGPQAGDAIRISFPSIVKWSLLSIVLFLFGVSALGSAKTELMNRNAMIVIAVACTFLGIYMIVTLLGYARERIAV
jgi:hypothetical protein